jgi:hypothetical protein
MNDVHEQYTLDFTTSYRLHLIYEFLLSANGRNQKDMGITRNSSFFEWEDLAHMEEERLTP